MRLLAKFSLIFAVVFGLGLAAAAFLFHDSLQRSAREQVLHEAQIMMETALAMRNYTTEQIRPVMNEISQPYDAKAVDPISRICAREAAARRVFRPQTVPAFAATEIFNYLRKKYPDYFYKEASLNPTNPRNRVVDWEEDILNVFRNRPDLALLDGERMTPLGKSLFLARPMRAAKSCLECHATPGEAPQDMVKLYGPANGFGWRENEIIAAQIVSVPVTLPVQMANRSFRRLLVSLVAVGFVTLVVLDVLLYFTVVRPVSHFARRADEISKGQMEVPELPVKGRDEVSILAASFNRMHRSLAAAMKMLEQQK
ncbi:MAG: signal protein [Deltaproteobacteria bacterium 13_1_20CM_2_69_21]|nr:MAG: signal protein [Deltaproteobacteria bacterium 13_1_40CM_4_68_19]OLD06989.1 MAG: signal protein [Deltaproteobacteria bacterium 13_1_40CM_3_69_14]OLD48182.1 MAG: signal protein [Chloroflexi bacterium 13_1_40CM_2_68_14]OLE63514.1 MAG: signal protein [Deltaproteobacteria bacterium 13_1_20CM_2_69_21]